VSYPPAGAPGPRTVTVRAPAKINLALSVGAVRPDGFHDLVTVFHAVDLHDTVTASTAETLGLAITGAEGAGLVSDDRNLAWRAAVLLAERAGVRPAVRLRLDKQIPVAAGLAGGSADAAATLVACQRLWRLRLSAHELDELAGQLGSDVAFALHGRSAVGTGRGEQLADVLGGGQFHWVLAAAKGELSTPAVYTELDRQRAAISVSRSAKSQVGFAGSGKVDKLLTALCGGEPARLAPLLTNDLQDAAIALAPYLSETLAAGSSAGALAGLVSGSGPTCAFLARDAHHARQLAGSLSRSPSCRKAWPMLGGVAGANVSDRMGNN
jgi:4-diphosphocytidyl-2-C-methyl-D-erythritol kinase